MPLKEYFIHLCFDEKGCLQGWYGYDEKRL